MRYKHPFACRQSGVRHFVEFTGNFFLRKIVFCYGKIPVPPAKPSDTITVLQTAFGLSDLDRFVDSHLLLRFGPFIAREDAAVPRIYAQLKRPSVADVDLYFRLNAGFPGRLLRRFLP